MLFEVECTKFAFYCITSSPWSFKRRRSLQLKSIQFSHVRSFLVCLSVDSSSHRIYINSSISIASNQLLLHNPTNSLFFWFIMSLDEKFKKAAEDVNKLKSKPSNEDLLEIYALFKQGSIGDCNTDRPGMLDLKGKAKWDSWNSKKGTTQDQAKEQYIAKVNELISSIGTQ